ncbi:hypothetical protein QJS10_CPB17g01691 [Acorus calamus]|uniref:UDP-N-acetylglucosamine transferase subunit ALG14 n=1 Tax=Acorus calamus TaxID=4465 RepID=A0AAV9CXU9_ACOCL|nr:hypothetical protein QJS10_CPB17g01691 [Acorus calamus]
MPPSISNSQSIAAAITAVGLVTLLLLLRFAYVTYRTGRPHRTPQRRRLRTLIVLGSGGHTAEMINLLEVLPKERFEPRVYIAAATDNMSLQKARVFESSLGSQIEVAEFHHVYRSREVGQSYITSVGTTLFAIGHALWLIFQIRPEVIICNGPGTCIPLCIAAFFFKLAGLRWSSIFYVESIARVRKLSLSGLLLYKLHLADQIFVQWPQLQKTYPKAHYVGRLM